MKVPVYCCQVLSDPVSSVTNAKTKEIEQSTDVKKCTPRLLDNYMTFFVFTGKICLLREKTFKLCLMITLPEVGNSILKHST